MLEIKKNFDKLGKKIFGNFKEMAKKDFEVMRKIVEISGKT